MDGYQNQQPERLEDQVRRMIVGNPPPPPVNYSSHPQQPIVRLPPTPSQIQSPQQHSHLTHPTPLNGNAPNAPPGMTHFPPNACGNAGPIQMANAPEYANSIPSHFRRGRGRGQFGPPRDFRQQQHDGTPADQQYGGAPGSQRARYQQQLPLDPNAFYRNGPGPRFQGGGHPNSRQLFDPNRRPMPFDAVTPEQRDRQIHYLEQLAVAEIRDAEMPREEHDEKEAFRISLQKVLTDVCASDPERLPFVSLECFGSFKSGFATRGSDMDLVIVVKDQSPSSVIFSSLESDLPRVLEKRLLDLGYGARLLSKTRVPIIKVCEKPGEELYKMLCEERGKWELLPDEEKYPHLYQSQTEDPEPTEQPTEAEEADATQLESIESQQLDVQTPATESTPIESAESAPAEFKAVDSPVATHNGRGPNNNQMNARREAARRWTRERKSGPLDFPKEGVGIQCDINFYNPLGLHNTQMLRCYSIADPRVRPMVLFVKAWAKRRKINSSYSGTLSSYGYVLMVLHYLVNVADPPVLPNLQSSWRPSPSATTATSEEVNGWNVSFWRNESEISSAAKAGQLTKNHEPLGALLLGFFQFYSSQNTGFQFRWMQQVLSLRSPGGTLSKEEKGWTRAVTEENEGRKVQQRYLFCIEDPFELNHNVARTVTHNGIVAIRDEFRRAKRILQAVGNGNVPRDGELFALLVDPEETVLSGDVAAGQDRANGALNGAAVHGGAANAGPGGEMVNATAVGNRPAQGGQRGRGNKNMNMQRNNAAAGFHPTQSLNVSDDAAFPSLGPSASNQGQALNRGRGQGQGGGRGAGRGADRGRGRGRGAGAAARGQGQVGNAEVQIGTTEAGQVNDNAGNIEGAAPGQKRGRRGRGGGRGGRGAGGRGGRGGGAAQEGQESGNSNAVKGSGNSESAFLEDVKRKNDEAQAQSTAFGAAEAVLGDF